MKGLKEIDCAQVYLHAVLSLLVRQEHSQILILHFWTIRLQRILISSEINQVCANSPSVIGKLARNH